MTADYAVIASYWDLYTVLIAHYASIVKIPPSILDQDNAKQNSTLATRLHYTPSANCCAARCVCLSVCMCVCVAVCGVRDVYLIFVYVILTILFMSHGRHDCGHNCYSTDSSMMPKTSYEVLWNITGLRKLQNLIFLQYIIGGWHSMRHYDSQQYAL